MRQALSACVGDGIVGESSIRVGRSSERINRHTRNENLSQNWRSYDSNLNSADIAYICKGPACLHTQK